jgi:hypothetical protein
MKIHSIIIILAITIAFLHCKSYHGKNTPNHSNSTDRLKFDTSKIAIVKGDHKRQFPFDETYKEAYLTQVDLAVIDSLFLTCVSDYNNSLDSSKSWWRIDLKERSYKMQLVVAKNPSGEKEVWINCFCWVLTRNWKTSIFYVFDGGSCFFTFRINLSKKTYYNLNVNGLA